MSPVEIKKRPCRPVEFKGQGPLVSVRRRASSCRNDWFLSRALSQ